MDRIEALELKIAKLLRIGVIVSGILMATGWLFTFSWNANPFVNYETYDQIAFLELWHFHLSRGNWGAIISYAGLVGLIALPVLRVLFTAFLFMRNKERLLAALAMVVFLCLLLSMVLGIEL